MPDPDLPFPIGPDGSDAFNIGLWFRWMQAKLQFLQEQITGIGPVAPVLASKTSDYQILASDSGTQFDNRGAAGSITLTLPPWAAGLRYSFVVVAAHNLVISTSDTINVFGQAYGSATGSVQYSMLAIGTSNAPSAWVVIATAGEWTYA